MSGLVWRPSGHPSLTGGIPGLWSGWGTQELSLCCQDKCSDLFFPGILLAKVTLLPNHCPLPQGTLCDHWREDD